MNIIRISVYDHSRLGGPMGSDDCTPLIVSKLFSTQEKADKWIEGYMKKHYPGIWEPGKELGDFGPAGIRRDVVEVDDMRL